MQDYYNTIPAFGVGGLIAKTAKASGRAKIQGHANLLIKRPKGQQHQLRIIGEVIYIIRIEEIR